MQVRYDLIWSLSVCLIELQCSNCQAGMPD